MLFNIAHRLLSLTNGPRLSTFIFHRVLEKHDPLMPGEPSIEQFDTLVRWIKKDFNVYALGEAIERFKRNPKGKPIAAITFDDGYADNLHNAVPILKKHGLAATFFVATGYLNGGRMWNDSIIESVRNSDNSLDLQKLGFEKFNTTTDHERLECIQKLINGIKYIEFPKREEFTNNISSFITKQLPNNLMMTTQELITLEKSGMEIGAHTNLHPILSKIDNYSAKQEILLSKQHLESILKIPVYLFAYPNGKLGSDYLPCHVEMVRKAGFKAAVSTNSGTFKNFGDLFQIPRFTPWQRNEFLFRTSSVNNTLQNND